MVIIWKNDGTIKQVNQLVEKILGYSSGELVGKKWFELYLPRKFLEEKLSLQKKHDAEKVLKNLGTNKELRIKTKSGNIIYTMWNSTLIRNQEGHITEIISVGTDITGRRKEEKKLRDLAYYDPVTSLPNRAYFEKRVKNIIKESSQDSQFALVYLDIDNFKNINDTLGHLYGDLLLKEVADIIINVIKPPDLAARLGGDEFGIIFFQHETAENVEKYLWHIIKSLEKPLVVDGNSIKVTVSMGVAFFPDQGRNMTELLKKADRALYKIKRSGKNGFCFYSQP